MPEIPVLLAGNYITGMDSFAGHAACKEGSRKYLAFDDLYLHSLSVSFAYIHIHTNFSLVSMTIFNRKHLERGKRIRI